jgi:hypothetical protein
LLGGVWDGLIALLILELAVLSFLVPQLGARVLHVEMREWVERLEEFHA